MEEWKSIPGYEGLYEVSSYGRVRSLEKSYIRKNGVMDHKPEIILRPKNNGTGYFTVCLYKNKIHKYYLIHRLVAQAFIPNPDNLSEVNHKDEDKSNNRVENLEWCTHQYNLNYNDVQKRRSQRMKENGIYEMITLKRTKYPELIGLDIKERQKIYQREYRKRKRGQ